MGKRIPLNFVIFLFQFFFAIVQVSTATIHCCYTLTTANGTLSIDLNFVFSTTLDADASQFSSFYVRSIKQRPLEIASIGGVKAFPRIRESLAQILTKSIFSDVK